MFARIENEKVIEIVNAITTLVSVVEIVDGEEIERLEEQNLFHPSLVFVECTEEVLQGWSWDGEEFSPPAPVLITWDMIRSMRDDMLRQTDWVVLRAYELDEPVPQEWKDYRKALRDITTDFADPSDVEWPEQPE